MLIPDKRRLPFQSVCRDSVTSGLRSRSGVGAAFLACRVARPALGDEKCKIACWEYYIFAGRDSFESLLGQTHTLRIELSGFRQRSTSGGVLVLG